ATATSRVVEDCLTNLHRHSGSSVARILIAHSDGRVRVEVEDKGKGIPLPKRSELISSPRGTPGVGIRGMRERLRQLGGTLEFHPSGKEKGTLLRASLPPPPPPQQVEAKSASA